MDSLTGLAIREGIRTLSATLDLMVREWRRSNDLTEATLEYRAQHRYNAIRTGRPSGR